MKGKGYTSIILLIGYLLSLDAYVTEYHKKTSNPFASVLNHQEFGMTSGGKIILNYNIENNNTSNNGRDYIVFAIVNHNLYTTLFSPQIDDNDSSSIRQACSYPSTYRYEANESGYFEYEVQNLDRYSVIVLNCFEWTQPIDVIVDLQMMNPNVHQGRYSYLPIDTVVYLRIFIINIIAYSIMFLMLVGQLYFAGFPNVKQYHLYFIITLLIIVFSSFMEWQERNVMNEYGHVALRLTIATELFVHLRKTAVLFTTLHMSLGWSVVRQPINMVEVRTFMGLLVMFVVLGFVSGVLQHIGDEGSITQKAAVYVKLILYIVKGFIVLVTIIAMNASISQLKANITNSTWGPMIPFYYVRLQHYYTFRNAFLSVLVMPTILIIMEISLLSWEEKWIAHMFSELGQLIWCFFIGVIFCPLEASDIQRAFDGSI